MTTFFDHEQVHPLTAEEAPEDLADVALIREWRRTSLTSHLTTFDHI